MPPRNGSRLGLGAFVTAWRVFVARDRQLACMSDGDFRHAGSAIMLISFLSGVGMVGVWILVGWLFGNAYSDLPLHPALAVWGISVAWLYRRGVIAAGQLLMPRWPALLWVVLGVTLYVLLVGLGKRGDDLSVWMPTQWEFLRPRSPRFRMLVLAPLWGAWGMLLTMKLYRPNHRTEPAIVALGDGTGALATVAWLVLLLAASSWWLGFISWMPIGVSLGAIGAALGSSLTFRLRCGAVSRGMLLGVNVLTQAAVLAIYQMEV
jgi:hypothetical protein